MHHERVEAVFFVTDIGFIVYWLVTFFHLLPDSALFKDYDNPVIVAWNWSFFPLDLLISFTGLFSIYLQRNKRAAWRSWALVSLVLTFCSGLQAIAFWGFSGDFDAAWWAFNLYLMIYPLFFLRHFIAREPSST
ncbi:MULTISPECIES: YvaD family protein [unclassified Paenibacillus]|uniref:YvaD family protein n=1 Tax=Paenibacillus sp. HGF7 TaxID=944559 RepID=UPI00020D6D2D|nr:MULTISPECIES: YvaD family protein [unclassified Paenibacillus]EGL18282.1 hypothetical protein HMPREF9413_4939 [Paenibacillus sp. HGF7]EPD90384.1 hypothetical protein HMPREF1207_01170 [Paenibacillus sp. HGH0039]